MSRLLLLPVVLIAFAGLCATVVLAAGLVGVGARAHEGERFCSKRRPAALTITTRSKFFPPTTICIYVFPNNRRATVVHRHLDSRTAMLALGGLVLVVLTTAAGLESYRRGPEHGRRRMPDEPDASCSRTVARLGSRLLVVGSGGAGKSTLARRLACDAGLPVIHLDAHYWQSGWQPTPQDEWRRRVADLVEQPEWVMEGNYSGTLDLRAPKAHTIVFLDLPRRVTLPRVVLRTLRHQGQTRPSMAAGCPERLTWGFLQWLWRYPRHGRARTLDAISAAGATDRLLRFTSQAAIDAWLKAQN